MFKTITVNPLPQKFAGWTFKNSRHVKYLPVLRVLFHMFCFYFVWCTYGILYILILFVLIYFLTKKYGVIR